MPPRDNQRWLELCKEIAVRAGRRLLRPDGDDYKSFAYSKELPKEIKALADSVLEADILNALKATGLPILSEESGLLSTDASRDLLFIVDPLDGTLNFVRSLGPCVVSIALWQRETPVFGVAYHLGERKLYWGGAEIGAWCDGAPLKVSSVTAKRQACICTGFPVRFDLSDEKSARSFWATVQPFSKVRMLGSAAASLLCVARGSADVYLEREIMLWDVAAGLAIVEGAGGRYALKKAGSAWAYEVTATNGRIDMVSVATRTQ